LTLEFCRLYSGDTLPEDIPDNLIVLGGQMGVKDEKEYPWLVQEKKIPKRDRRRSDGSLDLPRCPDDRFSVREYGCAEGEERSDGAGYRDAPRIQLRSLGTILPSFNGMGRLFQHGQKISSGADLSGILEDSRTYIDEKKRRCEALMDAFTRGGRE
jgi:hypothetical protein